MKKLTMDAAELAELLRLTDRHIRRLVAEKAIPAPDDSGQFDALAVVRAYVGHIKHDHAGRAARAELATATATLRRAQLRRMVSTMLMPYEMRQRGDLLWQRFWSAWQNACATMFYALPEEWPEMQRRSFAEGIRRTGNAYINEARDHWVAEVKAMPGELADPERVERLLDELTDPEDDAP